MEIDRTNQIEYHDKQLEALRHLSMDSPVTQLLYGGSAGGGKSVLICDWQIKRRLKYPDTRGLIGRAELKKLRLSTGKTLFKLFSIYGLQTGKHYEYNATDHIIKFYNGSEIYFMDLAYMPSDPDYQRFGSMEITDYAIDEAGEIEARCADIVHSRCRYNLPEGRIKGVMTCNPTKGWLYSEYYMKAKNNELPSHRAFVQALPTDNPHIERAYLEALLLMNEYDKQRLYYGNWEFDNDDAKLFFTHDLHAMFRHEEPTGEKYITADIARLGKDRSVIYLWHGLRVIHVVTVERAPITQVISEIKELRDTHGVPLKNIIADEDGIGGGVVDVLKCSGFVNGSKAKHPEYMNLKAECYFKLAEYIGQGKISIDAGNELKARIIGELETIKRHNADKDTRLQVTPKDEIKRAHGFSPDYADALMMRMFYELFPNRGNYLIMGARI